MLPASNDLKIKRVSASDQVMEKMKQLIKSGQWKLYEKIPSEAELAEIFGVNRNTIRSALQKLNLLGILDTRVGQGTFVSKFNFSEYIQEAAEFYFSPKLLESVHDFRETIETACFRLAIQFATDEELETLLQMAMACEDFVQQCPLGSPCTEEALDTLAQLDLNFHMQICSMSHNPLFVYAYTAANEAIFQYMKTRISQNWSNVLRHGVASTRHIRIYEAIKNHDFDACCQEYLKMINLETDDIPTP